MNLAKLNYTHLSEKNIIQYGEWQDIVAKNTKQDGSVFINSYISSQFNIVTKEPLSIRKVLFKENVNMITYELATRKDKKRLIYLTPMQAKQLFEKE